MKVRSQLLKARTAALLTGVTAIALSLPSGAFAADQNIVLKAPPVETGWEFHGWLEAGGIGFIQRPGSGFGRLPTDPFWLTPRTTESRAKFEEYGRVPQGLYLDWINLNAASRDGRYVIDFWGRHVGYNDQSFVVDVAEVGKHYFTLGWDQTPHLISTSAKSVFGGVGGTSLTVNPALRTTLQANLNNAACNDAIVIAPCPAGGGVAARAAIETAINNAATNIELFTQREKFFTGYRSTALDPWDFRVDYSHEHRTGVRPLALSWGFATSAAGAAPTSPRPTNIVEIPLPLDDTTQNVSASGEWVGTTFWGSRIVSRLGYSGSFFDQDINRVNVQNPFCITCSLFAPATQRGPNTLLYAGPPSNQANGITWSTATDIPWFKSRYTSTFQYNVMTQNDPFVNMSNNGVTMPPVLLNGVPVGSLDGRVDALLFNNTLTSRLTENVTSTLRFRHYDFDNRTPSLQIQNWIWGDSGCAGGGLTAAGTCPPSATGTRNSLPISYTKDNASAEFKWRTPIRAFDVGGGYFFERWDRHLRDVNVTNEHMGKVYANYAATPEVTARASYLIASRRYQEYNTEEFVGVPGLLFSEVASNMRRFDVANRDRHKGEFLVDWTPLSNLTVTPNAGFRLDDYPDSVHNPLGIQKDHMWNAGVEVGLLVNPSLRLSFSYNHEERNLNVKSGAGAGFNAAMSAALATDCTNNVAFNPELAIGPLCTYASDITQRYNTFILAADWKAIPKRLDFRAEYLAALGEEASVFTPCPAPSIIGAGAGQAAVGTNCNGLQTIGSGATLTLINPGGASGQFPTEKNLFQRFSLIGRYFVDPETLQRMGWGGDVILKVRYTAERNRNSNWATDNMTPYIPTADTNELSGGSRSIFLAGINPNYTVQLVAASIGLRW